MKQRDRTDKNVNSQLYSAWRISSDVMTQFFVIASLLIFSVVTYIFGAFPKEGSHIQDLLLGLSGNLIVAVIIFLLLERGIKSLHPISEIRNLPTSEFIQNMVKVKSGSRIRILETFTSLTNEYQEEFAAAVKKAIRNGTKIEILLFHPSSEGALKRAEQLREQTDVGEELRKNLARLFDLHSQFKHGNNSLEVKLYNSLPSIAMYRWGDWAYISLFPSGERSDRSPNLKVPLDNPFGSYVNNAFDELWVGTREDPTIPIESHMLLHIEPYTVTNKSLDLGYYFAYDEVEGKANKRKCYILEHGHASFYSIYEQVKERDRVFFHIDFKQWQAEPHLINPKDPLEFEEHMHAVQLIKRRYEMSESNLGHSPIIIRFNNIEEFTN